MSKSVSSLKVGDVVTPCAPYRWIPFGIVSLSVWGMLGFTPVMLFLIYLEKGEEVIRTFHGEKLCTWLTCLII